MSDKFSLIVEDDQDDVDLTLHALQEAKVGNEVKVVRDGEQALAFLLAQGHYSDRDPAVLPTVVLLDLKLPKIDGIEVLKARARQNGLAIFRWWS